MKQSTTKKLAVASVFAAVAVVGSTLSIPVFGAKCAPIQHMINILSAVLLGPGYAVGVAFAASFLRNIMGLGSLLAFPGSMCGAFLAGLLYQYSRNLIGAYVGEVFGTAIIGGILSYPIATLLMGNASAAVFTFVMPFFISTCGGTVLAIVITQMLKKAGVLETMKGTLA